jgi:cyanophycinase-like exopeptidase
MSGPKPVFLLAGGRPPARKEQNSLIQAVFSESGKAAPVVGYVGTANGDDTRFRGFMEREFKGLKILRVDHAIISPPKADLNKAKEILRNADVIFMGGGDPEEGVRVLCKKKMDDFMREMYREGKVFYGISAGSIMLAKKWVCWPDPDNDDSAELYDCLDIAPVICDTHDEAAAFEELQAAIKLEKPGVTGYGLASNTGIKVYPDGKVEAIGGPVWQFVKKSGKVVRKEDLLPAAS